MFKKIVLFALVLFPVAAFAQEPQKIAYVNSEVVIRSMPELKLMEDSLMKTYEVFQAEMKVITDEYTKKVSDYIAQQDTLTESIKLRRQQDIQGLQERSNTFQQDAQRQQEELQQALYVPILEKYQKAVEEVGKENNFLYIADSQVFRYISSNATNATPLVLKKLGIQ